MKYLCCGSGYYIDIGASQLIIDGKINLKRGQVVEIVADGVVLDDGTHLAADRSSIGSKPSLHASSASLMVSVIWVMA